MLATDVITFFKYLVNLSRLGALPELIALKENKITINPHHHCKALDKAKPHNPQRLNDSLESLQM